jgi:putative NIF3 family GTP cyclohydrolase 1 type 2
LRFEEKIKFENIEKFCDKLWLEKWIYNFGNVVDIRSIYFSSGGWLFEAKFAKEKNYDLLITWEWAHHEMINAKEIWQSIVLWWHYETEIFGIEALAKKLKKNFGIEIVFLDEKY